MHIDYDNTCEAIGLRVMHSDNLVRDAIGQYAACATYGAALLLAESLRQEAAAAGRFMQALIHDTIISQLETAVENEGADGE